MTDPQKSASWWQTLPGILTGLAAFITAISGLIALLYQNGFLDNKKKQTRPANVTTATTSSSATEQTPAVSASTPSRKPWSDMEAVILGQDGSTTKVRADSFSNCISVNHELTLEAGQSVPFNRMSSFEVLHADDHTSTNAKAKIKIELLNGSAVSGTVEANCDLFGNNDVGRFTTYYDKVRSVHFE